MHDRTPAVMPTKKGKTSPFRIAEAPQMELCSRIQYGWLRT